ncbi:sulfate transporter CysZ [Microbulbifer thermotolerans]|uniref:Sulfate transporter CysZ n=1 Tax=Microbulbifer thermotolerans TaxID=252514 RepID=A0A143HKI2_MICTH|nr:sulfate transporter CysZ [Microbulbifer thermotolerans]AMX02011.1 sulfate uptake protein [Microbulbifer thermotolerans]MCX2780578.1 sulfate transporter CysZ [Microbulbifer thermotolerans]MCX2783125.1 sulfate transporter CysZ [Microbulbifer thermotolerans]MCX2794273.1 sulfate transporter CysZ [Microbulbifer thermotolerans]MCX2800705.1 sulfate transporter CysZ [Microbulbifer thermotolerans]
MTSNPVHGVDALMRGARLLTRRELRPFVIVPLAINLVLFVIISAVMLSQLSGLTDYLTSLLSHTPVNTENMSWWESIMAKGAAWAANVFEWLAWIIALAVLLLFLFVYGYLFGIITNIIAAPFNGFLAEKVEEILTGKGPPPEPLGRMILRTLGRELRKLRYFIGWGLVIMLIALFTSWTVFVPAVLGALWGAWCMAIQYVDYPLDNHQRPFDELKRVLMRRKLTTLSFGGAVMLAKMVPVLNIFVMPAAVAGGTALWIERLRQEGDPGAN